MTDPDGWRTVWKTVVDLGWRRIRRTRRRSRQLLRSDGATVVLEECGAALAPVPLLSSVGLAARWRVLLSAMC